MVYNKSILELKINIYVNGQSGGPGPQIFALSEKDCELGGEVLLNF